MPLKRVLIVDDQHDIRQLLREAIRVLGGDMDLVDVPSGEEAMLVIARQRFDLLVSDVRLAGMSGLELVSKLRKRNPGLKVILVTGLTDSEVRQQVAQADAEAFFFKPVDLAAFQAAVRRCLELGEGTQPAPAGGAVHTEEDRLENLRADLGAECVWLVSQAGDVLRRSGMPAKLDEGGLVSGALAVHRANADLAAQLGELTPGDTLISNSRAYQMHLTPVGSGVFILALIRSGSAKNNLGQTTSLLRRFADELQMGQVEVSPAVVTDSQTPPGEGTPLTEAQQPPEIEAETVIEDGDLSELDAVFQQAGDQKVGTQELDAFWDGLAEQETAPETPDQGAITYEQARRLGLAPQDEVSE